MRYYESAKNMGRGFRFVKAGSRISAFHLLRDLRIFLITGWTRPELVPACIHFWTRAWSSALLDMLSVVMRERRKNSSFELQAVKSLDSDLATIRGDFAEYLRARGYAEATVEAYQGWLSQTARWLHESGKDLSSIFREEIWDFLTQHMRGRSFLTMSIYRKVLFHWLKFQRRFRLCARPAPWRCRVASRNFVTRCLSKDVTRSPW
jgi:hypothetical protein